MYTEKYLCMLSLKVLYMFLMHNYVKKTLFTKKSAYIYQDLWITKKVFIKFLNSSFTSIAN